MNELRELLTDLRSMVTGYGFHAEDVLLLALQHDDIIGRIENCNNLLIKIRHLLAKHQVRATSGGRYQTPTSLEAVADRFHQMATLGETYGVGGEDSWDLILQECDPVAFLDDWMMLLRDLKSFVIIHSALEDKLGLYQNV